MASVASITTSAVRARRAPPLFPRSPDFIKTPAS